MARDEVTIDGRDYEVTWLPAPFEPPRELTNQCGGVCFTDDGQTVLVTGDGETWGIPAGHPEQGEALRDALVREVAEEACARVLACEYLGCHRIQGPALDADWAHPIHFSAKFWARVELLPFEPKHETTGRKLVPPEELLAVVQYQTVQSAWAMLRAAQAAERRRADT